MTLSPVPFIAGASAKQDQVLVGSSGSVVKSQLCHTGQVKLAKPVSSSKQMNFIVVLISEGFVKIEET